MQTSRGRHGLGARNDSRKGYSQSVLDQTESIGYIYIVICLQRRIAMTALVETVGQLLGLRSGNTIAVVMYTDTLLTWV